MFDRNSVDLPSEIWRFIINPDTERIVAWDHEDNPRSGQDGHAFRLAHRAVGGKTWDHPSYGRDEVIDAVANTKLLLATRAIPPLYAALRKISAIICDLDASNLPITDVNWNVLIETLDENNTTAEVAMKDFMDSLLMTIYDVE